ncbi:MAG: hypothetical protein N4A40_15465 [Tissierellales bacterium]|jgi:hypothetical protein|nr:hypothetical protein [Tissierellales bacterium]
MNNNKNFFAAILILLGCSMLISRYINMPDGSGGLAVAAMFLVGYLVSGSDYTNRKNALLVAGSIITSISLYAMLEDVVDLGILDGVLFFEFLGLSFLAIHFISSGRTSKRGYYVPSWAFRVGVILCIFGAFVFSVSVLEWEATVILVNNVWPIGLIIAGVLIIWQNYNNKKR